MNEIGYRLRRFILGRPPWMEWSPRDSETLALYREIRVDATPPDAPIVKRMTLASGRRVVVRKSVKGIPEEIAFRRYASGSGEVVCPESHELLYACGSCGAHT